MPGTDDPHELAELRAAATPLWGIDVHPVFQAGLNIEALPAAGIGFLAAKVSQGRAVYPSQDWLRRANTVGILACGYHYMQPGDEDGQAQVFAAQLKAARVPGMLDAEAIDTAGRPLLTIPSIKLLIDRTRFYGGDIRLLYLPHWWWARLGSPDLSSLNLPLWSSSYPSTAIGGPAELYSKVTPDRWASYGGLPTAVLQFAETGSVAGTAPIDLDAYLGTRQQLASLLGISQPSPIRRPRMPYVNMDNVTGDTPTRVANLTIDPVSTSLVMPAGSAAWVQLQAFYPWAPGSSAAVVQWFQVIDGQGNQLYGLDPFPLHHRQRFACKLPAGATAVELVIQDIPPGGTIGAHLDCTGHA